MSKVAFLEVITRHLKGRDSFLEANRESLRRQTDGDFVQTVLVDNQREGIGPAQAKLADHAEHLRGEYIWILDDDDLCIYDALIADLKHLTERFQAEVVFLRMDHGGRGILPDDFNWGKPPVCGRIGCSAYVVKAEVWKEHAEAWRSAHYASDYDFIARVWDSNPRVYWHDVVASQVQMIGMGVKV